MYPSTPYTSEQHADVHAQARRQAQILRRAAVADFWHRVYALGGRALRAAHGVLRHMSSAAVVAAVALRTGGHSTNPASRNPSGV